MENIKKERYAIGERLRLLEKRRSARWITATRFYIYGYYTYFSGWKSWVKDMIKK
jgi:hypothetical protein